MDEKAVFVILVEVVTSEESSKKKGYLRWRTKKGLYENRAKADEDANAIRESIRTAMEGEGKVVSNIAGMILNRDKILGGLVLVVEDDDESVDSWR